MRSQNVTAIKELTVNWHILEACNYDCYYCYAKYGQKPLFARSYVSVLQELASLADKRIRLANGWVHAEQIKINFAGGEPLLIKNIGEAIEYANKIGLNPSIITNGSLLSDSFIKQYSSMLSVIGVSIDSLHEETNRSIGRVTNRNKQVNVSDIKRIFSSVRLNSPHTKLKLNTVVCNENLHEDFSSLIQQVKPDRWKVLQVIPIHGADDKGISSTAFNEFTERHRSVDCNIVIEDNQHMNRSYLMLDPDCRFYQRYGSSYSRTDNILSVGAMSALRQVHFDYGTYLTRY
jgi:radical S-adenosyl methionine domain-containing protein 2